MFYGDEMLKTFIYCEATEGGMDSYIVHSSDDLKNLYGWMSRDCRKEDKSLVAWMETAAVGEHLDHRLGVIVRLKDEEGKSDTDDEC